LDCFYGKRWKEFPIRKYFQYVRRFLPILPIKAADVFEAVVMPIHVHIDIVCLHFHTMIKHIIVLVHINNIIFSSTARKKKLYIQACYRTRNSVALSEGCLRLTIILLIVLPWALVEVDHWVPLCLHDTQHFWLHGDRQQFSTSQLIRSMQIPNPSDRILYFRKD